MAAQVESYDVLADFPIFHIRDGKKENVGSISWLISEYNSDNPKLVNKNDLKHSEECFKTNDKEKVQTETNSTIKYKPPYARRGNRSDERSTRSWKHMSKVPSVSWMTHCSEELNYGYEILNHTNGIVKDIWIRGENGPSVGELVKITNNKKMSDDDIIKANLKPMYIAKPHSRDGAKGGSIYKVFIKLIYWDGKEQDLTLSRQNDTGKWRTWFTSLSHEKLVYVRIHPCEQGSKDLTTTIVFDKFDKSLCSTSAK